MLESMIVELNAGEALPSLKQKGWERVGADGGAPYNLCEKIAKRMKSGKELVGSSFPEIYSTYFAFQSALELGMEDAVRQWRGIVALALLQDEYPFEMRTLPLNGTHKGAMQADFTEIGRTYAPVGEDFFLPRDPEHGDTAPSGLMVGYFDGAPRFAFSRSPRRCVPTRRAIRRCRGSIMRRGCSATPARSTCRCSSATCSSAAWRAC